MNVVLVDFWSDGNMGDAIMQKEIQRQVLKSNTNKIDIISCFGSNQNQINTFHESKTYADSNWHSAFFKTYIKLDNYYYNKYSNRYIRLFKTVSSLLLTDFKLALLKLGFNLFESSKCEIIKNADVFIFNGRNYRDYNSKLKNYINNRPLEIHHYLISYLNNDSLKLNAGFSMWSYPSNSLKSLLKLWNQNCYTNVSRESFSYNLLKNDLKKIKTEKDLSFPFISNMIENNNLKTKTIAIILTDVESQNNYIKNLNIIISQLKKENFEIIIVNQIYLTHESTNHLLPKLIHYDKVYNTKNLKSLIEFYSTCTFVISTRMHASIFSLSQNIPTASISYDLGAKWNIIKDEIISYPLFNPKDSFGNQVLEYIKSLDSKSHASKFNEIVYSYKNEYIKEYINETISNSNSNVK